MTFELDKVIDTVKRSTVDADTLYWCSNSLSALKEQVEEESKEKLSVEVKGLNFAYPFVAEGMVFAYIYPAEKKQKKSIKEGDLVVITDCGETYTTYISFLADEEVMCKAQGTYHLWQYGRTPDEVDCKKIYRVIATKKHDCLPDRKVAVISDGKTRTFMIKVDGLSRVNCL